MCSIFSRLLLLCALVSIDDMFNECHCKLMKPGCRRMLYLTCFVTVCLLSGPGMFGCLGKSPGERLFLSTHTLMVLSGLRWDSTCRPRLSSSPIYQSSTGPHSATSHRESTSRYDILQYYIQRFHLCSVVCVCVSIPMPCSNIPSSTGPHSAPSPRESRSRCEIPKDARSCYAPLCFLVFFFYHDLY